MKKQSELSPLALKGVQLMEIEKFKKRIIEELEGLRGRYKSSSVKATKQIEILSNLVVDDAIEIVKGME